MFAYEKNWPEFSLPKGKDVIPFGVEFEIANYLDVLFAEQKRMRPDEVRRLAVRGMVDPRVDGLVLPTEIAEFLGLPAVGKNEA